MDRKKTIVTAGIMAVVMAASTFLIFSEQTQKLPAFHLFNVKQPYPHHPYFLTFNIQNVGEGDATNVIVNVTWTLLATVENVTVFLSSENITKTLPLPGKVNISAWIRYSLLKSKEVRDGQVEVKAREKSGTEDYGSSISPYDEHLLGLMLVDLSYYSIYSIDAHITCVEGVKEQIPILPLLK